MKYFKIEEFNYPGETYHLKSFPAEKAEGKMSQEFLDMLDKARGIAGIPFKITSGYRPNEADTYIHRIPNSDHSQGLGADIAIDINNGRQIFIIIDSLLKAGFTRIGYGKNGHIHVSIKNKYNPDKVFWLE